MSSATHLARQGQAVGGSRSKRQDSSVDRSRVDRVGKGPILNRSTRWRIGFDRSIRTIDTVADRPGSQRIAVEEPDSSVVIRCGWGGKINTACKAVGINKRDGRATRGSFHGYFITSTDQPIQNDGLGSTLNNRTASRHLHKFIRYRGHPCHPGIRGRDQVTHPRAVIDEYFAKVGDRCVRIGESTGYNS